MTLHNWLNPGETPDEARAKMLVAGHVSNAIVAVEFSKSQLAELDLTQCLKAITDAAARVNGGDLATRGESFAASADKPF